MRYIKQIVNRNKKLVFVYLIIGLFNAFMVNFKADYFQKVIDALAEHTLSPYSLNYSWRYKSHKIRHSYHYNHSRHLTRSQDSLKMGRLLL